MKYVQTDPHRFGLSSSGPPRFPTSTYVQILIWWSGGYPPANMAVLGCHRPLGPWNAGTAALQWPARGRPHPPAHPAEGSASPADAPALKLDPNAVKKWAPYRFTQSRYGEWTLTPLGLKQWCLKSFQKPQIRSKQRPIGFHHSKYTPCCGYLEDTIWFWPKIGDGKYFMNNQHVFYWKWNFISLEYPGYFSEHTRMNHIVGCISHSIPIHIHCHELNPYWTHQTLWHTISSQQKMNKFPHRIVIFCYSPCEFPLFFGNPNDFPPSPASMEMFLDTSLSINPVVAPGFPWGYHGIPPSEHWMVYFMANPPMNDNWGYLHDLGIFRIGPGLYYIRVYIHI